MKVVAVLFFMLLTNIINVQAQFDPLFIEKISCEEANVFHENHTRSNEDFQLAPTHNYDLKYLNLNWTIDIITGGISGNLTYTFVALQNTDTFFLDCSDSLIIDSVFHQGVLLNTIQQSNVLKIILDQTILNGTLDSVTIHYHGLPQPGGLGGYMCSSHNGDSIVATLSQPYASPDWWPSKVSLDDKIDSADIAVQTKIGYKVGSNGLLKKIDTLTLHNPGPSPRGIISLIVPSEVIYHWKSRYPIATYLIGIAIYPYEEIIHQVVLNNDTLFIQHYIYPDFHQAVIDYTLALDSVLQLYTDLFGPYPFIKEKYGHAQWNRSGGMEHQTMSFVSDFGHDLIAHELAHQWFGDKITCGSWSDIWLNEGWATYATALTYEHLYGGYWWPIGISMTNDRALKDSTGSVYCTDTSDVFRIFSSRLSYAKASCLLHSLRFLMGDEKFFAATQEYLADTTLAYGFSRTVNFKQHLEQQYGQNLDEFFNDWYYGTGFPKLRLLWAQHDRQVVCDLLQTSYAHQNDGFIFDMSIPVKFYGNGIDTTFVLENNQALNNYLFSIPFTVDSVKIDPDFWWLIGSKEVTHVNYLVEDENVYAFPNPFSSNIKLICTRENETINNIEIYSIDGKRMLTAIDENNILVEDDMQIKPMQSIDLNLQLLASGSYYLRLFTNQSVYTIPVIKIP